MDPSRTVFRGDWNPTPRCLCRDAVSTVAELAPAEQSSEGKKAWLASNPMFCSSLRTN